MNPCGCDHQVSLQIAKSGNLPGDVPRTSHHGSQSEDQSQEESRSWRPMRRTRWRHVPRIQRDDLNFHPDTCHPERSSTFACERMNGVEGPLSQHRLFFAYVEHPRSARAVEAIGVLRLTHSFASEAVGSLRMTELRELMAPRIYTLAALHRSCRRGRPARAVFRER